MATEIRETKGEYSFKDESTGIGQEKHPILAVTCRAGLYLLIGTHYIETITIFSIKARQAGYYYWNGFCLIFLITISSFCIFSIPPE